jgi:hypothetical protein
LLGNGDTERCCYRVASAITELHRPNFARF